MKRKDGKSLLKIWFYFTAMTLLLMYSQLNSIKWFLRDLNDYQITSAKITSSSLEYHGTWFGWQLDMQYEYQVAGETFQSDRTRGFASKEQAEAYSQKHLPGRTVFVSCKVKQPEVSIFEPEIIGYFL